MSELAPAEHALLRFLRRTGALSADDVTRLSERVKTSEVPFHDVVEREGRLDGTALAPLLAEALHLGLVDLASTPLDPETVRVLSQALATRHELVPVRLEGGTLELATANPLDIDALKAVNFATGFRVRPVVATRAQILWALEQIYRGRDAPPPPGPSALPRAEHSPPIVEREPEIATTHAADEADVQDTLHPELARLDRSQRDVAAAVAQAVADAAHGREEAAALGSRLDEWEAEGAERGEARSEVVAGATARAGQGVDLLRAVVDEVLAAQEAARAEVGALRAAVEGLQAGRAGIEAAIARRLDDSEASTAASLASVKSLAESVDAYRRQLDASEVTVAAARLEAATAGRQATEAIQRAAAVTADDLRVMRERIDALWTEMASVEARLLQRREAALRKTADDLATSVHELRGQFDALAVRVAPREPEGHAGLAALWRQLNAATMLWSFFHDALTGWITSARRDA